MFTLFFSALFLSIFAISSFFCFRTFMTQTKEEVFSLGVLNHFPENSKISNDLSAKIFQQFFVSIVCLSFGVVCCEWAPSPFLLIILAVYFFGYFMAGDYLIERYRKRLRRKAVLERGGEASSLTTNPASATE